MIKQKVTPDKQFWIVIHKKNKLKRRPTFPKPKPTWNCSGYYTNVILKEIPSSKQHVKTLICQSLSL